LADSAVVLTVIGALRVVVAYLLPRLKNFDTRALELSYEIGAFSYAAMCGIIAAESLWFDLSSSVQTLTVGYAIGYGVAMASRAEVAALDARSCLHLRVVARIVLRSDARLDLSRARA
jgi:hypothetical protein